MRNPTNPFDVAVSMLESGLDVDTAVDILTHSYAVADAAARDLLETALCYVLCEAETLGLDWPETESY